MPTVNLLPNADISNSPAWTISSGSDVYAMLDDDDSGHVASDSSDIEATATGKTCVVAMQDLDAGLSGATINSVTTVVKHNNRGRNLTYVINTAIITGSVLYEENTGTVNSNSSWQTTTFTTRTTSDGVHAWTFADINDLRLGLALTSHSGGTTGITYAYYIVDYTEAVAAADNAVFFGANF